MKPNKTQGISQPIAENDSLQYGRGPTVADARRMGEKGAPHSEAERLLYEAYCAGHCWAVGPWVLNKKTGKGEYYEMTDRIRFAMWRDRAALQALFPGVEITPDDLAALRIRIAKLEDFARLVVNDSVMPDDLIDVANLLGPS